MPDPSFVWSSLSFAALAYGTARWRWAPAGLAPLITLWALLWACYIAGMTHTFPVLYTAFLYGGPVVGLAAMIRPRPPLDAPGLRGSSAGMALVLLALLCASVWYYHGATFRSYDEFFWGAFVKAFLHEGGVWTSASALARDDMSQAYPPLPAMLTALFSPPAGFREDLMGQGSMALLISTAFAVYHYTRHSLTQRTAVALAVLTGCVLRVVGVHCNKYYLMGYSEIILSTTFTALLCIAFFEKTFRSQWLLLLLGLPLLGLIKQTGLVLALTVLACASVRWWAAHGKNAWKKCVALTLPLGLAFGAYMWWTAHVAHAIIPSSGIASLLSLEALYRDPLLCLSIPIYLHAFAERSLILSPVFGTVPYAASTLAFLCYAGLLLTVGYRLARAYPRTQLWPWLLLGFGLLVWVVIHWLAALAFFSQTELQTAASYERYIGSYIAAFWTITVIIFARHTAAGGQRALWTVLGVQAIALLLIVTVLPWQRPGSIPPNALREKMQRAAEYLTAHTPEGARFALVPLRAEKAEDWALRYLVSPTRRGVSVLSHFLKIDAERPLGHEQGELPSEEQVLPRLAQERVDYLYIFEESPDLAEKFPSLLQDRVRVFPMLIPLSPASWSQ